MFVYDNIMTNNRFQIVLCSFIHRNINVENCGTTFIILQVMSLKWKILLKETLRCM